MADATNTNTTSKTTVTKDDATTTTTKTTTTTTVCTTTNPIIAATTPVYVRMDYAGQDDELVGEFIWVQYASLIEFWRAQKDQTRISLDMCARQDSDGLTIHSNNLKIGCFLFERPQNVAILTAPLLGPHNMVYGLPHSGSTPQYMRLDYYGSNHRHHGQFVWALFPSLAEFDNHAAHDFVELREQLPIHWTYDNQSNSNLAVGENLLVPPSTRGSGKIIVVAAWRGEDEDEDDSSSEDDNSSDEDTTWAQYVQLEYRGPNQAMRGNRIWIRYVCMMAFTQSQMQEFGDVMGQLPQQWIVDKENQIVPTSFNTQAPAGILAEDIIVAL